MRVLHRIWTGIVAAITGAALALMIQVAGILTVGMPIDWLGPLLVGCSVVGFIFGAAVGPRTITKPANRTPPD